MNEAKTKKRNKEETEERNYYGEGREMFGSKNILSQRAMTNLAKKYNISDAYCYKAHEKGEYLFDPKPRETTMFVTLQDARLRFPFHFFFT